MTNNLGIEIKRRRKEKGWTQSQLAKRANITTSYVSLIETGKIKITNKKLEQINTALDPQQKSFKIKDWRLQLEKVLQTLEAIKKKSVSINNKELLKTANQLTIYRKEERYIISCSLSKIPMGNLQIGIEMEETSRGISLPTLYAIFGYCMSMKLVLEKLLQEKGDDPDLYIMDALMIHLLEKLFFYN